MLSGMAIAFQRLTLQPLHEFTATAQAGAVTGLIGEGGSGVSTLLRAAAGLETPVSGVVEGSASRRYLAPAGALVMAPADIMLLDYTLDSCDALVRARAAVQVERLRRAGISILLASHDEDLLRQMADEMWWIEAGSLAAQGDPGEVIAKYRASVAGKLRAWGATIGAPLAPSLRRGDGRARLTSIETLGEGDRPTMVWGGGAPAAVRVRVQFEAPVDDPVVGIMIRTRIGFEVYGTNTELERLKLGPCQAGDTRTVVFRFSCDLCPQEYTLTAASHDPDGTWHDWLEDALAVTVTGSRYTAGVADLRARVSVE
jgi:lipopolysaccharide transport system ATP-binding protein